MSWGRAAAPSLVAIAALALAVRGWHATAQNLWFDEVVTARIATTPLTELLHPTAVTPIQPTAWLSPLFFASLEAALWIAPSPVEATLRWWAVVVGTLGVVAIAVAAGDLLGRRTGLTAGVIAAVAPFHVWYSQEVRPYVLLVLLATVAVAALHRGLDRGGRGPWCGFVGATALAWYAHPIALVVPAVAVVDGTVEGVWRDRARLAWLGSALGAIGIAGVPALLGLLTKGANVVADPRGAGPFDLAYALYTFAVGFSLGPSTTVLHERGAAAVAACWPIVTAVAVAFGTLGLAGVAGVQGASRTRLLAWSIVPLVVPFAMARLSGNPLNVRYVIVAFPAFVAWTAAGVEALRGRRGGSVVIVGAAACIAASLWNLHHDPQYAKEDCRGAARVLATDASPADVIVVNASYMQAAVAYYFTGTTPVVGVPRGDAPVDADELRRQLAATVDGHRTVWLVRTRTFHGDRDGLLPAMLSEHRRLVAAHDFAGVRVERYDAP